MRRHTRPFPEEYRGEYGYAIRGVPMPSYEAYGPLSPEEYQAVLDGAVYMQYDQVCGLYVCEGDSVVMYTTEGDGCIFSSWQDQYDTWMSEDEGFGIPECFS